MICSCNIIARDAECEHRYWHTSDVTAVTDWQVGDLLNTVNTRNKIEEMERIKFIEKNNMYITLH